MDIWTSTLEKVCEHTDVQLPYSEWLVDIPMLKPPILGIVCRHRDAEFFERGSDDVRALNCSLSREFVNIWTFKHHVLGRFVAIWTLEDPIHL